MTIGKLITPAGRPQGNAGYQVTVLSGTDITGPDAVLFDRYYSLDGQVWDQQYEAMYHEMAADLGNGNLMGTGNVLVLIGFNMNWNAVPTPDLVTVLRDAGAGDRLTCWLTHNDNGSALGTRPTWSSSASSARASDRPSSTSTWSRGARRRQPWSRSSSTARPTAAATPSARETSGDPYRRPPVAASRPPDDAGGRGAVPRVLFVGHGVKPTGRARVTESIISRLLGHCDVIQFAPNWYGPGREQPWVMLPNTVQGDPYGHTQLAAIVKLAEPDTIVLNCECWEYGRYAPVLARLPVRRVILHCPVEGPLTRTWSAEAISLLDVAVTNTDFAGGSFATRWPGCSRRVPRFLPSSSSRTASTRAVSARSPDRRQHCRSRWDARETFRRVRRASAVLARQRLLLWRRWPARRHIHDPEWQPQQRAQAP